MNTITQDLCSYMRLWQANHCMDLQLQAMKSQERQVNALPDGPVRDPMERVDDRLDWCDAHRAEYQRNREAMGRVQQAISRLEDPLERQLLRLRYTDSRFGRQLTWKEVADQLYGCQVCPSTVFRHHRRALEHLTAASGKGGGAA